MSNTITGIISNAVLITGLVTVMMMLIECFNVRSQGNLVGSIKKSGVKQIVTAALLGAIPGCMGGFAVVSLYTHGLIGFGALVAMMIASSGDEAFVMLAMFPEQAMILTLGMTAFAVLTGIVVDRFIHFKGNTGTCKEDFAIHEKDSDVNGRHFGWKRLCMLLGVAVFLVALCLGMLENGEHTEIPEAEFVLGGINLLSEDWMNVLFAGFGIAVMVMILLSDDHFIDQHLWEHVIREHLPKIFLWTAGALASIAVLLHYVNISSWIGDNVMLMIIIAAAVGLIPESGPHMLFVTLYASGMLPLSVLIASCISQDGHAAIPLLAEDKRSFLLAKTINFIIACAAGFISILFFSI